MPPRRSYSSYNDGCAAAHALDLIGDRWTMIIVRELLLGPKRFTEIQRDIVGIGPTVLTQRLHELETIRIARRRRLPAPARVDVYELTPWGLRLEAVNAALSTWAIESPSLPLEADMSPDTVVLAMRAHARPDATISRDQRVTLYLTDSRIADSEPVAYTAHISARETSIEKTPAPAEADAKINASTADWKACIIGGAPFDQLSDIRVVGSREASRALIRATSLGTVSN